MKIYIAFFLISLALGFSMTPKLPEGFSYINQIDPSIIMQIRYATPLNFIGKIPDGYIKPVAIITTKAAYALKSVQQTLRQLGYSLVIYDAYRPQKAVDNFVEWCSSPQDNKTKQQFYPYIEKSNIMPDYVASKSGHTRGSVVDLTIIRLDKKIHDIELVDYTFRDGRKIKIRDDGTQFMCGHFDLFDLASHHDTNLITFECSQKRNLLRDIMKKNGFKHLQEEWWHYILIDEPFPTTYFNFDVE